MNLKKPTLPSGRVLWTVFIVLFTFLRFVPLIVTYAHTKDIKTQYVHPSVFMEALTNDDVFVICKVSSSKNIQYQLREDIAADMLEQHFSKKNDIFRLDKTKWYETTVYDSDYLANALTEHSVIVENVNFDALNSETVGSLTRSILLLYVVGLLMISVMPGTGKLFAPKYTMTTTSDKRFSDIVGQDEIIEDLRQYINILRDTKKFKEKGIKQPNGLLFTGPPGTGKTLIAKALAGEAGLPFIYFNSSSAIDMYVGMGARTVRNCFACARKNAPCILFIDELDAIGGSRSGRNSKTSEDNQTLLALLQELDGFEGLSGILIIGATNCPDNLDPALKRAGRFDRQICINPPRNKQVRKQMLQLYTDTMSLADDVNLDEIAAQTQGMTGADISAICNEAAILGVIEHEGVIHAEDFVTAIDKFMLKGNRIKSKSEIEHDNCLVAYHEAGHAVATYLTGGTIARISVHGTTSGVGGYVLQEDEDKLFMSKKDALNQLVVLYAGRASEEIKFGHDGITPGASNDIQKATNLLSGMLLGYGYNSALGMLDYNQILNSGLVDKGEIIKQMQVTAAEFYQKAVELLRSNYSKVEALAEALLRSEELTGAEAIKIIESEDLHGE